MATPICGFCKSTRFEAQPYVPAQAGFTVVMINCESCGAVIGVIEFTHIGRYVRGIAEALVKAGIPFELPDRN